MSDFLVFLIAGVYVSAGVFAGYLVMRYWWFR